MHLKQVRYKDRYVSLCFCQVEENMNVINHHHASITLMQNLFCWRFSFVCVGEKHVKNQFPTFDSNRH